MNPGGVFLMLLGTLGLCQLFGGDVLGRLKIVKSSTDSTPTGSLGPGETLLGGAPPGTDLPDLAPGQTLPDLPDPDAPSYQRPTITGA